MEQEVRSVCDGTSRLLQHTGYHNCAYIVPANTTGYVKCKVNSIKFEVYFFKNMYQKTGNHAAP
jgi:hypothetical protein